MLAASRSSSGAIRIISNSPSVLPPLVTGLPCASRSETKLNTKSILSRTGLENCTDVMSAVLSSNNPVFGLRMKCLKSLFAGPFDFTTAPSNTPLRVYLRLRSLHLCLPTDSVTGQTANAARTPSTIADVPRIMFRASSGVVTGLSSLIFAMW